MAVTAASLLALCFDDLEAITGEGVLGYGGDNPLQEFEEWALVDLLVERFPEMGHPSLRYEVQWLVDRSAGDPLELLRGSVENLEEFPPSGWNDRFPLDIFATSPTRSNGITFDIADAHLHSGASIPLPLLFGALGSSEAPLDRSALKGRRVRSRSGAVWDLYSLLAAIRWALRLLRYLAADNLLGDYHTLEESRLRHRLVDLVIEERFWPEVARLAKGETTLCDEFEVGLAAHFDYEGLCSVAEVFWRACTRSRQEFPGGRGFLIGLLRVCCAVSGALRARPGDGLSRFVDRFRLMGVTRDLAVGELKEKVVKSTLDRIANSHHVVGAEFRKTIAAAGPKEFKAEILESLEDHHQAFADFVDDYGRPMALSMPVGFRRQPCTGRGGDWTDISQLREAIHGYNALRLISLENDGPILMRAISTIDVAGDEYGSASWPFVAAAELLHREGLSLGYAIHAGEAFYSALNGVRRVGELFLAERVPDRIGHALALSDGIASKVCRGSTPPPIRIGDAICDLSWSIIVGCGDAKRARNLLYRLVPGPDGGHAPQLWIDAYERLFHLESLFKHRVLTKSDDSVSVPSTEDLRRCAMGGEDEDRVFLALASGFDGLDSRIPDVKALVSDELRVDLQAFDREVAPAARELVRALLGDRNAATKTTIESCPTSNIRLAGLGGLHEHPIWEWKKEGLSVVIGSDDPIIFGATISDEFEEMVSLRYMSPAHMDIVQEVAADTVACCSGGDRRKLDDLHAIASRGAGGT